MHGLSTRETRVSVRKNEENCFFFVPKRAIHVPRLGVLFGWTEVLDVCLVQFCSEKAGPECSKGFLC